MKRFNLFSLILSSLFLIFSFTIADGQVQNRFQDVENPQLPPPSPPRPNLLQELELSPEQIQQVRRIMRERQPSMREAGRRFQEANQALDRAIYADSEDEGQIQKLMKEVNTAHLEVLKNRTLTEQAIRRILSPEQLVKFRSLRGQFTPGNNPQNKINKRQDKLRNIPRNLRQRRLGNRQNQRQIQ